MKTGMRSQKTFLVFAVLRKLETKFKRGFKYINEFYSFANNTILEEIVFLPTVGARPSP